ncbi:nitrate reductase molybdenum cofactor assembly chaperone [Mycolicibacterium vaccae]|uniref:nitrate reductase molybdenum cofactor assembly chaperone n=1 Tax=Mycolicibacterium vaccae TaxID=1810 RepID=UPI003CEB671A
MRLRRPQRCTLSDRLVWQSASLLLSYPDRGQFEAAAGLLEHVDGGARAQLRATLDTVRGLGATAAATQYVDTFDLRRRATMYLTYWTTGDTRNRGRAMLEFSDAYRRAGVSMAHREAPDHLPVVLEFAATVDPAGGRDLLVAHRVPLGVLHGALCESDSPYASTVAAVLGTLPAATDADLRRVQHLSAGGAPVESVGLQPFTLTVPPRRGEQGRR